ncbi:MAG: putative toxin-antitoxin system toxin component, PIN family [Firmicutes bacterium]|nr:putative toxin-antitoxin system toxin component, PIN family [Bacillota bacterium]
MIVAIDTNVLISAGLFSKSITQLQIEIIADNFQLIITSTVLDEFNVIVARKFPNKKGLAENYISELNFQYYNIDPNEEHYGKILELSDLGDYNILASVIASGADVFITGDKAFLLAKVDTPLQVMSVAEFIKKYCN